MRRRRSTSDQSSSNVLKSLPLLESRWTHAHACMHVSEIQMVAGISAFGPLCQPVRDDVSVSVLILLLRSRDVLMRRWGVRVGEVVTPLNPARPSWW